MIVCSHNGATTLGRALCSLSRQTLERERYEIIVVDDGSEDGTSELSAAYEGVRTIRLETNAGLAAARNAGVAASRAGLVAFTDDDCEADPEWAAAVLQAFEEPHLDGIGGAAVPAPDTSVVLRFLAVHNPLRPLGAQLLESNHPLHRLRLYLRELWTPGELACGAQLYSVAGASMAFRRQAILDLDGFDEAFAFGGEEEDLCRRLHARTGGAVLRYEPRARVLHYFQPGLGDTLRRSRSYGRGNARSARKHQDVRPIVYPAPVVLTLAAILAVVTGRPRWLAAALAGPLALYPGWWRNVLNQRSPEPIVYPYIQLLQELYSMAGQTSGWRAGYQPIPSIHLNGVAVTSATPA